MYSVGFAYCFGLSAHLDCMIQGRSENSAFEEGAYTTGYVGYRQRVVSERAIWRWQLILLIIVY